MGDSVFVNVCSFVSHFGSREGPKGPGSCLKSFLEAVRFFGTDYGPVGSHGDPIHGLNYEFGIPFFVHAFGFPDLFMLVLYCWPLGPGGIQKCSWRPYTSFGPTMAP